MKELEQRCKVLTVENETLKAEVEMYRDEFGSGGSAAGGTGGPSGGDGNAGPIQDMDHFVKHEEYCSKNTDN